MVENGIIAAQTGRGEDYRHDKVLRAIPVGKNLELKKGIEQSVSFEYRIPEEHTADNTDIIAYILTKSNSGEQIINNVVEFAAGSDIGYEYEKLTF